MSCIKDLVVELCMLNLSSRFTKKKTEKNEKSIEFKLAAATVEADGKAPDSEMDSFVKEKFEYLSENKEKESGFVNYVKELLTNSYTKLKNKVRENVNKMVKKVDVLHYVDNMFGSINAHCDVVKKAKAIILDSNMTLPHRFDPRREFYISIL